MAGKRKPAGRRPTAAAKPAVTSVAEIRARKLTGEEAWELLPPRCACDRADDLDEVQKMIAAGETDVARDELRWLLDGCSDFLVAHKLLGELALAEGDVRLARGHFGYAFEIGRKALDRAGAKKDVPYRLAGNQAFFEAAKGLAFCLRELDKPELLSEVVARLLECDPSDPLGVRGFLEPGPA